jgi:8-oxo-dGTP pyrophosphatase MutT (NUDIX family)
VAMMNTVIAAYCYKGEGKKRKILLITSTTGRWIVPKGQKEKDRKNREVALLEAWEEAGVVGEITGGSKEFYINRGSLALWKFYPIKIIELADRWPEKKIRDRRLVSAEKAELMIDNIDLSNAVSKLAIKTLKKVK